MIELTNTHGKPLFLPPQTIRAVDSLDDPNKAAVYVDGVPNHFVVKGTPREVSRLLTAQPPIVPHTT